MTPQLLLCQILVMLPEFAAHWNGPENYCRNNDGSFTMHGVFMELTGFFLERSDTLLPDQVANFGKFLSECMASNDEELDNATATCFLENIAGKGCDHGLGRHLSGAARVYWQTWGGRNLP